MAGEVEEPSDEENMLEALQTRHTQRLEEFKTEDSPQHVLEVPPKRTDSVQSRGSIDTGGSTIGSVPTSPTGGGTLNMSIRERLKNRAKSGALDKSLQPRKLRGLRERSLPTRFEEPTPKTVSMVAEDLDPTLQQSIATTKHWKKLKLKKDRDAGIIAEEDAFQFFCGSLGDDDGAGEKSETGPLSPASTAAEIPGFDESPFYAGNVKPQYVSHSEQLLTESQMYYYPSSIPALPEAKIPSTGGVAAFRDLEDEGFYVGVTPKVGLANLSRMENRIIAAGEKDGWFGVDGHLKRLADPLKERPVRHVLTDDLELDPSLQLGWGKAEMSSLDTRYIDEHGNQHFQLDIDISMIRFRHQQFFSKEHFIEFKLVELYESYLLRDRNALLDHLRSRINALYNALDQTANKENEQRHQPLKRDEEDEEDDGEEKEEQPSPVPQRKPGQQLSEIHHEIQELRANIQTEEMKDRSLLMNILNTWKLLKTLREAQMFVNTTTTLKVRKELTNRVNDEMEIKEELKRQVANERFLFNEHREKEMREYRVNLNNWEKYRSHLRERQERIAAGETVDDVDIPEVLKPSIPPTMNEQQVRTSIREWMTKYRRKPGEPVLSVELQNGAVITPTEKCSRGEQLRRADMKNSKYFVKVVFNDMEVARTAVRPMTSDFFVQFGEILNVRILQWPESIKLEIIDAHTMKQMCELFAPIPDLNIHSTQDRELSELEFSSPHVVQYNRHDGIGCGVLVDFNARTHLGEEEEQPIEQVLPPVIPLTTGVLYAGVSWGVDENNMSLAPPQITSSSPAVSASKHFDALASLGAEGMVDLQKLLTWIRQAKLDPNDPTNADIITLAKMAQLSHFSDAGGPQFFRLNHLDEDMEFTTKEQMDASARFRLLKLRSTGVSEFKHYRDVPIDDKFIAEDIFDEYDKKHEEPLPAKKVKKAVARYLEQVREKVHARYEMAKRQVDLEDIVTEEAIPDLGSLGARIGQIMEPRRPLRPMRKERKKIGGQGLASVKEVNILVNVIRAFNLPLREFDSLPRPIDQSLAASLSAHINVNTANRTNIDPSVVYHKSVYPFVEVVFQGNKLSTTVAEGSFPSWNEDLILPFKAPNNDYTCEALQMIKDVIYISLFDEVLVDAITDERLRENTIHQRIEKRYLGRIEIPFSTVYFNSKVEGFIPLKSPKVLLGYQPGMEDGARLTGGNLVKEGPLMQLFVTIDPQLQPAPPMPEIFESSEHDVLISKCQTWLSEVRAKFPDRVYKTMVTDLDGKKLFVTRYLHPQKPPVELVDDSDTESIDKRMKLLSRFVSLIPYISDSVQFPDLCDIWTSSEQFLRMLAGDEEEHAVLLCNFFLWLGRRAYIVLGYGIPEGKTAYVLTEDKMSYRVWNPSTGDSYEVENVHCPLRSVGTVIAVDNVYGNIQPEDHPSKISYVFSNTKCWKPFFTRAYRNPGLASIQSEELPYTPVNTQHAIEVQDDLERRIRDNLMNWRTDCITKFNRGCNQAFKTLLEGIETKIVEGELDATEHRNYVEQFASSHHLTGYTIQMPFTKPKKVVEGVFCTGIHNVKHADVEFALAVNVHAYPCGVEAVWVYIGSLVRKGNQ